MALVTLQVLEGLERGRVFEDLPTPVSIGREDDNSIRLNDERVSRFHAKIQEDSGQVILTDLESTNGTRVNGHPVQIRILQPGDQLSIGRCLLVYGSFEEIAARAAELSGNGKRRSESESYVVPGESGYAELQDLLKGDDSDGPDPQPPSPEGWGADELFPVGPPTPPRGLRPAQRAAVSDFLAYAHEQIRLVLQSAVEEGRHRGGSSEGWSDDPLGEAAGASRAPSGAGAEEDMKVMRIGWAAWQRLLKLEMDLAQCLQKLAEPEDADGD